MVTWSDPLGAERERPPNTMLRRARRFGSWIPNWLAIYCVLGMIAVPAAAGPQLTHPVGALNPFLPSEGYPLPLSPSSLMSTFSGPSGSLGMEFFPQASTAASGLLLSSPSTRSTVPIRGVPQEVPPSWPGMGYPQPSHMDPQPASHPIPPGPTTQPLKASISRNLPECASHDPTIYHGLVDEEKGCHYDHTHNASPYTSALWDLYREVIGPNEISNPWQTPHENERKHQAYKYAVWPSNIAAPGICVQDIHGTGTPADSRYCIVDFLLQYHASPAFGMGTRFHSFAGCFSLKTGIEGGAGEACFGGWSDYLKLMLPYKDPTGDVINLAPLDPVLREEQYGIGSAPYLAARPFSYCSQAEHTVERDLASHGVINHSWNSGSDEGDSEDFEGAYGSRVQFDFTGLDAWGGICPQDPTQIIRVDNCPHCNNSQARIYEIVVRIPDLNGDGSHVRFRGYTNLLGNIDESCVEPGPECAPAYIDAMPGRYLFRIPIDSSAEVEEYFRFYDFDIYFDGEPSGWIEFPD